VVKRKMSNFGVKRVRHRAWPQPTLPAAQAVVIVGASKPAPIRRPRPSSHATSSEPAEPTKVIGIDLSLGFHWVGV